jgi:ribosomal protein S16
MTEELKEQIHERVYNIKVPTLGFSRRDLFNIAMEYAEPREKQIQIDAEQIRALQKQNGELTDRVKELEAQITDMKNYCCEVSKYLHDYSNVELNSPECRKRDILLIKELKLCKKWGDLR